ncbi:MAG: hypothetical protein GX600_05840 [Dehalococcoidia bacterium]|nr:hypothetical protein [Dehalococcoidia bacterium]
MGNREAVLDLIRQRTGHEHILAVPRAFISLTGGTQPALLLAQLLYWSDRAASPEGWVYKSRAEWVDELGTTARCLDSARARLRTLGLVEESHHLANNRRVLHMRLSVPALCAALQSISSTDASPPAPPPSTPPPAETCPQESSSASLCCPEPSSAPDSHDPEPARAPLLHRDRLLARMRSRTAAQRAAASATVNAPAEVCAVDSSKTHVGAVRSDGGRQSAVPPGMSSELRFGEVRVCRDGGFGLPVSYRPITETTAETSPEISSQSSCRWAREVEGGGRSGGRGSEKRYAVSVTSGEWRVTSPPAARAASPRLRRCEEDRTIPLAP